MLNAKFIRHFNATRLLKLLLRIFYISLLLEFPSQSLSELIFFSKFHIVIDQRRSDNAFLQIIESRFPQLHRVLSEIQDIIVHLESDAEVGSEVEEGALGLQVEGVDYCEASAPERDHGCCFVVCLAYVTHKVIIDIETILIAIDFHITFGLNQFSLNRHN